MLSDKRNALEILKFVEGLAVADGINLSTVEERCGQGFIRPLRDDDVRDKK